MAASRELVGPFDATGGKGEVRSVVLTATGKAFCAGIDFPVPGTVPGLDASEPPPLADGSERLGEPAIAAGARDAGGRVTLAVNRCALPMMAAITRAEPGIGDGK